jgi:ferritin-like protein
MRGEAASRAASASTDSRGDHRMAEASAGFHEAEDKLRPETRDRHRAIVSLMEELEAVDWYDQRVDAADDDALREILAHNRDEEKEHACMILEWLRRRDPALDHELQTYLNTEGPITALEEGEHGDANGAGASPGASDGSLCIGSLKQGSQP